MFLKSVLETVRDREAWRTAVHGVGTKSFYLMLRFVPSVRQNYTLSISGGNLRPKAAVNNPGGVGREGYFLTFSPLGENSRKLFSGIKKKNQQQKQKPRSQHREERRELEAQRAPAQATARRPCLRRPSQ